VHWWAEIEKERGRQGGLHVLKLNVGMSVSVREGEREGEGGGRRAQSQVKCRHACLTTARSSNP